jgi:hypothetical protein
MPINMKRNAAIRIVQSLRIGLYIAVGADCSSSVIEGTTRRMIVTKQFYKLGADDHADCMVVALAVRLRLLGVGWVTSAFWQRNCYAL